MRLREIKKVLEILDNFATECPDENMPSGFADAVQTLLGEISFLEVKRKYDGTDYDLTLSIGEPSYDSTGGIVGCDTLSRHYGLEAWY